MNGLWLAMNCATGKLSVVAVGNGSNPGTPVGEIFATVLHLSSLTERLLWRSQSEKSKVSNQPLRVSSSQHAKLAHIPPSAVISPQATGFLGCVPFWRITHRAIWPTRHL